MYKRQQQPQRVIEKKGPAVSSGVDAAGKPTRALEGFMRSAGVAFEQLQKAGDGKADYFVARIEKSGESLDVYKRQSSGLRRRHALCALGQLACDCIRASTDSFLPQA